VSALDELFTRRLPALLARHAGDADAQGEIAFVATGPAEAGAWRVDLARGTGARADPQAWGASAPLAVVEASAAVLTLWLSGALDVDAAVEQGALTVRGDPRAFDRLRRAISAPTSPRA
jgi:hypothetical protein